jgi:hypothetical protein
MAGDEGKQENKAGLNAFAAGLPIGIGTGLALGVALGLALDNLALGLALGIALGAGMSPAFGAAQTKTNKNAPDAPEDGASQEEKSQ